MLMLLVRALFSLSPVNLSSKFLWLMLPSSVSSWIMRDYLSYLVLVVIEDCPSLDAVLASMLF